MSSPSKRREADVMKLMMKDFKVEMTDDMKVFFVEFHGPNESLYQGGVWRTKVELDDDYPFRAPYVRFLNKICHPNISETFGSICLNVIDEDWSSVFDLVHVFEVFLPQLLLYPNPSDPVNKEAGQLMISDQPAYETKVKEYCQRYAKPEDKSPPKDESSDEQPSENDNGSTDEQVAGTSDPQ